MDVRAASLNLSQCRLLESAKVNVSVVLGEFTISAQQLLDISAGQAFSFSFDAEAKFRLYALGEAIGSGRLVSDGGELFIEVLETAET